MTQKRQLVLEIRRLSVETCIEILKTGFKMSTIKSHGQLSSEQNLGTIKQCKLVFIQFVLET